LTVTAEVDVVEVELELEVELLDGVAVVVDKFVELVVVLELVELAPLEDDSAR